MTTTGETRWPAKPPKGTPCDTRTYSATGNAQLNVDGRCPRPAVETLLPPVGYPQLQVWLCTECADYRVAEYGYRRNPKRRPTR